MKAAQIDSYGDVSQIQVREVEKPTPGNDQLLIEVGGASLNPFDLTVLSGGAQGMAQLTFPATLGLDIAGHIVEIGSDVSGFAVGDFVYGTANAMFGASGAFAQFAMTSAANIGHAPSSVGATDAASLPTAGISGLQAIDTLNIQSGQKIFIHGGAGGAGTTALQIAKSRGAYVAVTASADNTDFVKSLGADEIIDYRTQRFTDVLHGYDAVFTTVRSDDINDVLQTLKHGGVAVSLVGPFDEAKALELNITTTAQFTQVTTAALDELRTLVEQGSVKPLVDKVFALDQITEAYIALTDTSIRGKIAISTQ